MSFNVLPFGSTPGPGDNRPAAQPVPAAPQGASFAEVVDLASRRARLTDAPEIPEHVWNEVEAASQLWHELRAENREVRFDSHDVSGRVVASLCDLDGGLLRVIPLHQAIEVDDDDPGTAA
jgi:hypothetical protein